MAQCNVPDSFTTRGWWCFDTNSGKYKHPQQGDLDLANFRVVSVGDPSYGNIYCVDIINSVGIPAGTIGWNQGGPDRDRGQIQYEGQTTEVDVMQLPFGNPVRSHVFVDLLP